MGHCAVCTPWMAVQNVGKTTPNDPDPPELECSLWASTLMVLVTRNKRDSLQPRATARPSD